MNEKLKTVLVTGGAGYVGSVLVPRLLEAGYMVRVLDLFIYGEDVLDSVQGNPGLTKIKGDMRDRALTASSLAGVDAVIHLACISNDPSYELDPELGKSINYDAAVQLHELALAAGVQRFVFASSSSVYGIKEEEHVTEELPLEPLTDYSKYKALYEKYLLEHRDPRMTVLILRPSTVCGWSPRLRLDLSVNILTNAALTKGKITVFGGEQQRPNIHIEDMAELYVKSLEYPAEKIDGKIFNAGFQNMKMKDIALAVQSVVAAETGNAPVEIVTTPTNDNRSYRVDSGKISRELGYAAHRSVEDAVRDLVRAYRAGKVPNPDDLRFCNIKVMRDIKLK